MVLLIAPCVCFHFSFLAVSCVLSWGMGSDQCFIVLKTKYSIVDTHVISPKK